MNTRLRSDRKIRPGWYHGLSILGFLILCYSGTIYAQVTGQTPVTRNPGTFTPPSTSSGTATSPGTVPGGKGGGGGDGGGSFTPPSGSTDTAKGQNPSPKKK